MGAVATLPALSSQPAISSDRSSSTMKFLILAALVAVAAADYHDDTFHFSTVGSVSGLQKSAFVQAASPVVAKKYNYQAASPVYSSFVQPAYTQQVAAPVLFKSIEEEIPAFSQQYTVKQAQPVVSQYAAVKEIAQPIYSQQYAFAQPAFAQYKQYAQPAFTQYKQYAQPAFTQYKQVAQPAFEYKQAAFEYKQPAFEYKTVAKPVYTEYKTVAKPVLKVAEPVYTQYKAVAKPVISQYAAVKKVAEPVFTQYKQVAQPAFTQYSALYPQQYSDSVSTYASNYNAPQFRILSQVQEADPAGPYKLAFSTENGIQATEQGSLIEGTEGAVVAAQGSYSYTGPDNKVYTVNYIADENGFRASGDHIPAPSAEIVRSLHENAASGEQYDDQGNLVYKH